MCHCNSVSSALHACASGWTYHQSYAAHRRPADPAPDGPSELQPSARECGAPKEEAR